eukprot:scaffold147162_cov74-Cyclotella_meneghiniana.AAC.6
MTSSRAKLILTYHALSTEHSRALSTNNNIPLRRIEIDLRPQLPHPIIAYERDQLEEDHLLERALGADINGPESESTTSFHDILGLHAWPSGFVAAKRTLDILLPSSPDDDDQQAMNSLTVLELGCGTGIPSLAAYNAGANVIATDLNVDLIYKTLSEQQDLTTRSNTYKCIELDLLDKHACEQLIQQTKPNLVITADCLYDTTLARAVGETMGMAADTYGCNVLAADPGRLKGEGRELFLDGFFGKFSNEAEFWRQVKGFEDVDMPQETLKASGASLSWCGELEIDVGVFTWFNLAITTGE